MNNNPPSNIQRIHLIFKTHLDVGFTDFAATVVQNYFNSYIPRAIKLARELRESHSPDRFIWTTGSWLIYEYLEFAGKTEREQMEEAITAGDITWHALPFTTHSENMDAGLFRFGLSLSQELDRRFDRKTIAAKMTDVPGHTRAIIPLLADAGVKFLHIGVNGASTPPDVPPVFLWRDPNGAEIIVMYHKGSYGDLMIIPGMTDAISFAHTGDNLGPQSVEQLGQTYAEIRNKFPDCEIQASTMDAFTTQLLKHKESLPVCEQEIGDTWIHGAGSDPKKEAHFRELLRLRREWIERGIDENQIHGFNRKLLQIPEHTWGLDVKTHLNDWTHYAASEFQSARNQPNFRKMEQSWDEQRGYLRSAVNVLPDELKKEAAGRLSSLAPARPEPGDYEPIRDYEQPFQLGVFKAALDAQHGCLTQLETGGKNFAQAHRPLGRFWYETFSASDYNRFHRQYNVNQRETNNWAIPDFTKPGIESCAKEHKIFLPELTWAGTRSDESGDTLLVLLEMPNESRRDYGAPESISIEISASRLEPVLNFRVQWFNKAACRQPEALWFSFIPQVKHPRGWKMDKLGQWISPYEVIRNGNRHLHAVGDGGFQLDDAGLNLNICSADTALAAPGEPSLLNFNNRQPNLEKGIHFNLYNNLWGTNFPMWYEEDALFRFSVKA